MWSPFKGKAPPSLKGTSSTAVSALNIALTTSAGVAPVALLRHSTVLETRLPQHHQRMTSDATSTSMCSPPSTVQEDSTAPSSPRPKKEEPRQVVVLLDGDHDYFKKGLLEQGHRGGKKAAIELHRRVESLVQEKEGLEAPRPDVLLMLFWNKTGLSQHLAGENGGRGYDLSAFAQGFSNSPFAAVAVDTGFSPQSADEAIKAHLRIHIKSADYLFLGGSHDGGYASALHQLENTAYLRKVILLRTSSVCTPWLADLQLEEARFEDLFNGAQGLGDSKYGYSKGVAAPLPTRAHSAPIAPKLVDLVPSHSAAPSIPAAKPSKTLLANQAPPPTTYSAAVASPVSTPSPSFPDKFQPLVAMLESERQSGWRRSSKDHLWGKLRKSLRSQGYGDFGPYLKEAESVGVVKLHDAETGRVWIHLLLPVANDASVKKAIPEPFLPLVSLLKKHRAAGRPQVLCSALGEVFGLSLYQSAGVSKFGDYIRKAKELGLVKEGGPAGGAEWVALVE